MPDLNFTRMDLLVTVKRNELEGSVIQEILGVLSSQVIPQEENIIFIPKKKCLQSILTTLNLAKTWYELEPIRQAGNK